MNRFLVLFLIVISSSEVAAKCLVQNAKPIHQDIVFQLLQRAHKCPVNIQDFKALFKQDSLQTSSQPS